MNSTPRPLRFSALLLVVLGGATVLSFTGCVSSKYKLAKNADLRPAVAVNLAATQPPLEVLLTTVIVYQGPGSWKREAYWDEYVLTLANRGDAPLTIDSVSVTGLAAIAALPGVEPWSIEKQSRTLYDHRFGFAEEVGLQIGGGVATIAVSAAAGAGVFTAVYGAAYGAGAYGAVIVSAVALPAFVGGSIYANISSRHEVEREFARRRLNLPATLVGGQVAQGSLYFAITPGPRRLAVRYRVGPESRETVVDLTPLAGLHLKTNAVTSLPVNSPRIQP